MKTSRKVLLGALAIASLCYELHHHHRAEAHERVLSRASNIGVDLLAYRTVPAWFVKHPGASCDTAVASLAGSPLRDGWRHPYHFSCQPGARRDRLMIRSAGADGDLGTADDIVGAALPNL
jgi:hypothetical protein